MDLSDRYRNNGVSCTILARMDGQWATADYNRGAGIATGGQTGIGFER